MLLFLINLPKTGHSKCYDKSGAVIPCAGTGLCYNWEGKEILCQEIGPEIWHSRCADESGAESPCLIMDASNGDTYYVQLLLERGDDVNAKRKDGLTALMAAAGKGHVEITKLLLEKGADVNAKNKDGLTALMGAAGLGHIEVTKLLLEKGVDVNAINKDGMTALMFASYTGHTEIVALVKDAEAKAIPCKDIRKSVPPKVCRNFIHQNPVVRINVTAERIIPNPDGVGMAIQRLTGWGSGFIVSSEGYIVTNEHVASASKTKGEGEPWEVKSLSVTIDAGKTTECSYPAEVIAMDPAMDIAVLRVTGTFGKLPVAQLGLKEDAAPGKSVKIKGYPGGGPYKETSCKVINNPFPEALKIPSGAIVSDIEAVDGISGGPLVSEEGLVLGVVVRSFTTEQILQYRKDLENLEHRLSSPEFDRQSWELKKLAPDPAIDQLIKDIAHKVFQDVMSGEIQENKKKQPTCYAIPVDSVVIMLQKWGIPFENAPIPSK
jgi:S1-C subfamily serine protease